MENYVRTDYYTLARDNEGSLGYIEYKRLVKSPERWDGLTIDVVKFDTFEQAYAEMINLYADETLDREDHKYWFIMKHSITEYVENGEPHRNEMIEPVWG